MAAGTQTARGGFMAPAAALRLGEMSSLDCTSDTRTLSGLLSEQTPRRVRSARTRPREAGATRCVRRVTPKPVICFICDTGSLMPAGHRQRSLPVSSGAAHKSQARLARHPGPARITQSRPNRRAASASEGRAD